MGGVNVQRSLSTLNTTTEVPLSKAPNPRLLPGHRGTGCSLLRVCAHCRAQIQSMAVSLHFTLYAEEQTGNDSRVLYFCLKSFLIQQGHCVMLLCMTNIFFAYGFPETKLHKKASLHSNKVKVPNTVHLREQAKSII